MTNTVTPLLLALSLFAAHCWCGVIYSNVDTSPTGGPFGANYQPGIEERQQYVNPYAEVYHVPTGDRGSTLGQNVAGAQNQMGPTELDELIRSASQSASTVLTQHGIHIFDRGHQYLEGQFAGEGATPHGYSYHIAGQGQGGSDSTSLGSYIYGRKEGFHFEFIDGKIWLCEYQRGIRKANPIEIRESECPGMFAYFRLDCSQKPKFLQGVVEALQDVSGPRQK